MSDRIKLSLESSGDFGGTKLNKETNEIDTNNNDLTFIQNCLPEKDTNIESNDKKQSEITKNVNTCNFEGCNKKLSLIEKTMKCKCDGVYCGKHKHANKHNCNFDYIKDGKKKLEESLVKIEGNKIQKI